MKETKKRTHHAREMNDMTVNGAEATDDRNGTETAGDVNGKGDVHGKVLVAYATRYGSTGDVAEAIGSRLSRHGLVVDVRPVKEARPDDGYDAVVFGAPIYLGRLPKDAQAWLEKQHAALEERPVAIFALGPTSAADDLDEAGEQLDKVLEKLPWLHPTDARMFVGKFDPKKLRLADKLLTALPASPLHGLGPRDDRDWDAIAAWADGLVLASD
jgi:menaquinone-dependent protoporphyrinogen oxidase